MTHFLYSTTGTGLSRVTGGLQRLPLPTQAKGNQDVLAHSPGAWVQQWILMPKRPPQLRSVLQAGSVLFIRRIFLTWSRLPLVQVPEMGERGASVGPHIQGSEAGAADRYGNELSCASKFLALHFLPCFSNSSL